jgi:long-chain acyl-CoA synthetase
VLKSERILGLLEMDAGITQALKRAIQINPRGIAMIDGSRTHTWEETGARVARLAGGLRKLGMKVGDKVGIAALNADRYLEYYFGTFWAGGVVVPMNVRHTKSEIAFCLNDSSVAILFIDDARMELGESLRSDVRSLTQVIHFGDRETPAPQVNYEKLIDESSPIPDVERAGNDLAGIFYTGGTTGRAKGVLLSHANLVCSCLNMFTEPRSQTNATFLHTAPLFHMSGVVNFLATTFVGGKHVLMERFEPMKTLEFIERYRPQSLIVAPTMLQMLLDQPDLGQRDLSSLEMVVYASAPMPEAQVRRAIAAFPETCGFRHAYGMTETGVTTVLPPHMHFLGSPKLHSVGRATLLCEVRVFDEYDREVPRRTVGEIVVRGPTVMQGYLNMPEESERALRNGWMHTGDGGYMDEDGFLYVVDRLKDMIISGGENIYSAEVEQAIYTHPSVAQCAVIGIPSEKWGESVHAIVVPRAGMSISEKEINAHCRRTIAGYKCPRTIEIRAESLPVSAAGKIQKVLLREAFWRGHDRKII